MDRILSDRAFKIIVLVVGILVLVDVVNVFVLGGPSVFTLLFKPGGTAAGNSSPIPSADNVPVTPTLKQTAVSSLNGVPAIYVPTTATPIPTVPYVSVVTPIQTSNEGTIPTYVMPAAQTSTDQNDYMAIYSNNLAFITDSPTAVAFNVGNPPLLINYTVTPTTTVDYNYYYNHTATQAGTWMYDNVTRPSEHAWFTITIYDKDTGKQVDQSGYGGIYGWTPQNTYSLRKSGNFLIQFDGENANVLVNMFLSKEGNSAS